MATVKVTQIKSAIDRPKDQKATLKALGLTKMNKTVELEVNDSIQGMLRKISHLVTIEE